MPCIYGSVIICCFFVIIVTRKPFHLCCGLLFTALKQAKFVVQQDCILTMTELISGE